MKVYIVTANHPRRGISTLGVAATPERASALAADYMVADSWDECGFRCWARVSLAGRHTVIIREYDVLD